MIKLDVRVMNHPQRRIHKSILREFSRIAVHTETAGWKLRPSGSKRYDIRTIQLHIFKKFLNTDSTHLLLIQDDVKVGKNFKGAVEHILERGLAAEFMIFYNPYKAKTKPEIVRMNVSKPTNKYIRGQTNLLSRSLVELMVSEDSNFPYEIGCLGSDEYLIHVLHKHKLSFLMPHPSFVQHGIVKSRIGNQQKKCSSYNDDINLLELVKLIY